MKSKYYSISQEARIADVYIFGDITAYAWPEYGEVSASSFKDEIAALDVDVINVHINSYGGSVSEGWAIYNALRDHKAKVVTRADGFVASAALYPFMAGDERIASNLSAFFFHQVMESVYGNADMLREAADEADKLNEIGLAAFSNAGIDTETVLALEKAETWLSAAEALEYGIATAVIPDAAAKQTQSVKRDIIRQILKSAKKDASPSESVEREKKTDEKPVNSIETLLCGLF